MFRLTAWARPERRTSPDPPSLPPATALLLLLHAQVDRVGAAKKADITPADDKAPAAEAKRNGAAKKEAEGEAWREGVCMEECVCV